MLFAKQNEVFRGLLREASDAAPAQGIASGSADVRSALDGCFLLNLDGDNFLGVDYLPKLSETIACCAVRDSVGAKKGFQGTTGRVGLWAPVFLKLGGYDESYLPMGYQDVCIHQRIRHVGGSCRTVKGAVLGLSDSRARTT